MIPALRGLRQEDHEFKANLGYTASSRPRKTKRMDKGLKLLEPYNCPSTFN